MAEMHHRDRYYLGSFGADLTNKDLLKKYEKYREVWIGAQNVGELPVGTLLGMAVAYPSKVPVKPIVTKPAPKKQKVVAETL